MWRALDFDILCRKHMCGGKRLEIGVPAPLCISFYSSQPVINQAKDVCLFSLFLRPKRICVAAFQNVSPILYLQSTLRSIAQLRLYNFSELTCASNYKRTSSALCLSHCQDCLTQPQRSILISLYLKTRPPMFDPGVSLLGFFTRKPFFPRFMRQIVYFVRYSCVYVHNSCLERYELTMMHSGLQTV